MLRALYDDVRTPLTNAAMLNGLGMHKIGRMDNFQVMLTAKIVQLMIGQCGDSVGNQGMIIEEIGVHRARQGARPP